MYQPYATAFFVSFTTASNGAGFASSITSTITTILHYFQVLFITLEKLYLFFS